MVQCAAEAILMSHLFTLARRGKASSILACDKRIAVCVFGLSKRCAVVDIVAAASAGSHKCHVQYLISHSIVLVAVAYS